MTNSRKFYDFFPRGTIFKPILDELVTFGKFYHQKLKSSILKFYLQIFPHFSSESIIQSEWIAKIKENREEYEKIKEKFHVIPNDEDDDEDKLGPLTTNKDSKWAKYFNDKALKEEIEKDTSRLFQSEPFFQKKRNLEHINEILFLHVRQFPEFKYLQGFHELCGVIFYIFTNEMTVSEPLQEDDPEYGFKFLFSEEFVDADVFWTYSEVINYVKDFYMPSTPTTSNNGNAESI